MALGKRLKQLKKHFGVSAPKLSVKTHVAWPWRALVIGLIVALVGGMVWTGFDAGRLLVCPECAHEWSQNAEAKEE